MNRRLPPDSGCVVSLVACPYLAEKRSCPLPNDLQIASIQFFKFRTASTRGQAPAAIRNTDRQPLRAVTMPTLSISLLLCFALFLVPCRTRVCGHAPALNVAADLRRSVLGSAVVLAKGRLASGATSEAVPRP